MSDDVERRLRDALRAAPLPAAPDALHAALETVAAAPVAPGGGRLRARLLPGLAIAAVLVVAIVGIGGISGIGRVTGPSQATPGTTTGPMDRTPGPAVTPGTSGSPAISVAAPPTSVHVLTADELRAAIAEQRAGGLEPQVVVAGVDIKRLARRGGGPTILECADPIGSCTVIGSLAGPGDAVTVRAEQYVVPPPTAAADLRAPVAIRLNGTAPIEYLGHVDVAPGSGILDVPALQAATATSTAGTVLAVTGWLEGVHGGFSCGPAQHDAVPEPFRCQPLRSFLSSEATRPVTVSGNSASVALPDGAVPVQWPAYESFAPSPANDGTNDEPRLGLYLVRAVVATSADCPDCRGWLVVGRLDVTLHRVDVSVVPATATVRSAGDLEALLATDRAAWIGKPVLVDGRVVPGSEKTVCITCGFGTLEGTTERVFASTYTASLMLPDTDYQINGVMAFTVRADGLEYLGPMRSIAGNGYVATPADLQDPTHMARGPETFIVSGWLVEEGPIPCPLAAGPTPPQDTPFVTCPAAWLTQDEVQPVTSTATTITITEPPNAIRVQWGAYEAFAPDPETTTFAARAPRFGTYLVRLVTNTAIGPNGPRGWQVVARLAP